MVFVAQILKRIPEMITLFMLFTDNCESVSNQDQIDSESDGVGDDCGKKLKGSLLYIELLKLLLLAKKMN